MIKNTRLNIFTFSDIQRHILSVIKNIDSGIFRKLFKKRGMKFCRKRGGSQKFIYCCFKYLSRKLFLDFLVKMKKNLRIIKRSMSVGAGDSKSFHKRIKIMSTLSREECAGKFYCTKLFGRKRNIFSFKFTF